MNKVYLVGAGAGDIGLLTLDAVNILREADIILYDALVNEAFFKLCKSYALKINVGKRKGNHSKKQEEINDLLIQHASSGKVVVRLKGGTPFVFGRGFEEVRALRKAGFEPIIFSGVSSTTSVPESFMIPLIDRAYNDSYRTITGHDIKIFDDIITNYHPRENIVVMMGIHNLKNIVNNLLGKNFPQDLPLAILSKGTTKDASKIVSTLRGIASEDDSFFEDIKLLTPAIIFIGHTVDATNNIN